MTFLETVGHVGLWACFLVADLIHLVSHPQEKTKIYTREDFHEVLTKVADFHDC